MALLFRRVAAGAESPPGPAHVRAPGTPLRTLLSLLAAPILIGTAMALPARAFDLQYRQNGTSFSASELARIFNAALPATYDQRFPEKRWTTYLLVDAHADQALVAITLGLSPRVGTAKALLPVATLSVNPCPARRINGSCCSLIWLLALPA